ncbi:RRNAD protein, partial [Emberiza fucata]|nr:RRNAD protein [Emberiza fucata]
AAAPPEPPWQSPEQRRAADIIRLLSLYRPLLDAFVIDFFTEGLWSQLPPSWQPALAGATPEQLAGFLGGRGGPGAAWPLSLLAFGAAARALAFPRGCPGPAPRPPCQSSRLPPLLRRHLLLPPEPPGAGPAARNPLGGPGGSEDGHRVLVTGLHACGDLGPALLCHFARSPAVAAVALVGCCYMKLSSAPEQDQPPGYPLSASVAALPGHQLSYRAREAACHALEEYQARLRGGSAHLRAHCYRAVLESLIRAAEPGKRHLGLQPGRKAHTLSFTQYAQLGLPLAGLDPLRVPLDSGAVGAMLEQQHKVVAFCTL